MKKLKQLILLTALLLSSVTFSGAALRQIGLTWDNNTDTITGYRIYTWSGLNTPSTSPAALAPINVVGTNLYIFAPGQLSENADYTFRVTAYVTNTLGEMESEFSDMVDVFYGLPPAPTITKVTGAKATGSLLAIDIAWMPLAAKYEVTNYFVRVVQGTVTNAPIPLGLATNIRLTAPYASPTFVHVWATNTFGPSSASVGQVVLPGKPGRPRRF